MQALTRACIEEVGGWTDTVVQGAPDQPFYDSGRRNRQCLAGVLGGARTGCLASPPHTVVTPSWTVIQPRPVSDFPG